MTLYPRVVAFLSLVPLAASAAARNPGITETWDSSHAKLKSVGMKDVRWTRGFWADRFNTVYKVTIPTMRQAMETPGNGARFRNFRVAAGLEQGPFQGRNWSDGDVYKWIETVAYVYDFTRDQDLDRRMDEIIEVIGKAQAPDGYISTQVQLPGRKRWGDVRYHELYNMGHLMTAASIHQRVTGKPNLLNIAKNAGDYLYTVFQPRPRHLAHFGYNPTNIMGLVELYRTTRNPKYLELAGVFVDLRGSAPGGTDHNQTRTPLRKETEAVGHAVLATYLYCGAADVYAETGEQALFDALERLWRNVTTQKMYLTGGAAALHYGVTSHRDPTHEAFGMNYQLPNRTGYNETCANIANAIRPGRRRLLLFQPAAAARERCAVAEQRQPAALEEQHRARLRRRLLLPAQRVAHHCQRAHAGLQRFWRGPVGQPVRQQHAG